MFWSSTAQTCNPASLASIALDDHTAWYRIAAWSSMVQPCEKLRTRNAVQQNRNLENDDGMTPLDTEIASHVTVHFKSFSHIHVITFVYTITCLSLSMYRYVYSIYIYIHVCMYIYILCMRICVYIYIHTLYR